MSEEYDVAVIGAGPAGLSFINVYENKSDLILIERQKIPRDKPCGGMLVEESINYLKNIPRKVLSRPDKMTLSYIDFDNKVFVEGRRKFVNVNRKLFDFWLFESIRNEFVTYDNTVLVNIEKRNDFYKLKLMRRGEPFYMKTKSIIGADGATSVVRRNVKNSLPDTYLAVQKWYLNENGLNEAFFIFDSNTSPFYSWLIPKGNQIILGTALLPGDAIKKIDLLKNKLFGLLNIVLSKSEKTEVHPTMKGVPKNIILGRKNAFLIGEAAGLISPSSGEGISFALRSGEYCADAFNEGKPELYYTKVLPLINEVKDKYKKYKIITDPDKRINILQKLGRVEEIK